MDRLVAIAEKPWAKRVWQALPMPMRLPPVLRRASAPWSSTPLAGRQVVLHVAHSGGGAPGQGLGVGCAHLLEEAGARVYGAAAACPPEMQPDVVLLDATGVSDLAGLDALWHAFHPWVGRLAPGGRCLVVAQQPGEAAQPAAWAAFRAIDGFVRSLAKEVGRHGATAHWLSLPAAAPQEGATWAAALAPVLRFVASDYAAFISAQPWHLSAQCAAPPQGVPTAAPLAGKNALVTGAARGIGEAIARTLAREGAWVLCIDRPEAGAELQAVAAAVGGSALELDLAHPTAPAHLAHYWQGRGQALDVVVHNAGVTRDRTLARMDEARWAAVLEVNLRAVVRCTDALQETLAADARVVAISSVAGLAGNLGQTNYAASKAGLVGYVAALAQQLAPRRIGVTAVAPGFIETRMTRAIPWAIREAGRRLAALKQGGVPQDVAELVTFLASPGAYGLSGQTVRICGGMFFGA